MGLKYARAEIMGYAAEAPYIADKFVSFNLGTERLEKGKQKRMFFHIVCFGSLADRAKTIILKGGHYLVRGNLDSTKYQDQAHGGVWKESFKILANEIQIVDSDVQDPSQKTKKAYTKKNNPHQYSENEITFDPYPEKQDTGHIYTQEDAEYPVDYEAEEVEPIPF